MGMSTSVILLTVAGAVIMVVPTGSICVDGFQPLPA